MARQASSIVGFGQTPRPRRRPDRGLGPFSGGQLTAIVIAAIVMLGLPVGAFAAVSASNVFISGANGGRANVDASGGLQVSGTPPNATVLANLSLSNTAECGVLRPPPGKALILSAVEVTPSGATVGNPLLVSVLVDPTACKTGGSKDIPLFQDQFGSDDSQQITLPPGIGLKNGQALYVEINGASHGLVSIYGHTVPASECAAATTIIPSAVPGITTYVGCL